MHIIYQSEKPTQKSNQRLNHYIKINIKQKAQNNIKLKPLTTSPVWAKQLKR